MSPETGKGKNLPRFYVGHRESGTLTSEDDHPGRDARPGCVTSSCPVFDTLPRGASPSDVPPPLPLTPASVVIPQPDLHSLLPPVQRKHAPVLRSLPSVPGAHPPVDGFERRC